MHLTHEEQRVVALFASMPPDAKVRFPTWFVELGVPLAMGVGGWLAERPVFVAMAFGGLLAMHALRLFRQFTYARALHGVFTKLQAHLARDEGHA